MESTHRWSRRLKIALPLALGLICVCAFLFLCFEIRETDRSTTKRDVKPTPEAVPSNGPHAPFLDPSAKNPYEKPEPQRFGGRYPRWNLKSFPDGWNPELADDLHTMFETMEFQGLNQRPPNLAETRESLKELLASLGPEALPTLGAILNAESDFVNRRFLLYGIGDLGPQSEEATFHLRDFFVRRHEDPQAYSESLHVIRAMSRLQNETSYSTIMSFVGRGNLHRFRPELIRSLGEHPERENAVGSMVEYMRDDAMGNVRNRAAQFLGKVGDPKTLDDLYHGIDAEPQLVVQQTMLGSIGKIGNPNSIAFLENHARRSDRKGVRLSAARAISRIGTPYAFRILKDISRSEPDPGVRQRIEKWAHEGDAQ